ncbi:MAG: phosphoribosylglycinamide formyltransferase [Saprospiraceae bacterium]
MDNTVNIAIFASGGGSNARKIMEHFQASQIGKVALIVCNKPEAGVLDIAREFEVPSILISRKLFYESRDFLETLQKYNIGFIALAGFLWLIPDYLVQAYPNKIVNIHPALLPKYGGKGMYGMNVHKAVKANGESQSGISIHFVNEHYDEGNLIFQATCALKPEDGAAAIAKKVLEVEHRHYARVIETIIQTMQKEERNDL